MPTRTLDAQIDRLYQLPLDEFTVARNTLAKETGNGEVKRLQKPPAAAWAINQVYWRRRADYDAFSAAAAALKQAHAAVLTGKRADLRAAGKAHEDALDAVLKAALAILADSGQPATDATKQAIASTLRAMPSQDDEPGRLTRTLQPGGFEMLAGLPLKGGKTAAPPKFTPAAKEPAASESRPARGGDAEARARAARAKAIAAAKDALAEAQRAEKAADQEARREEFEAAKSARDAERAETRLTEARAALEAAQEAVDEAEQTASAATRKRDAAARRVKETADTLARARVRAEAARAELARAEKS